MSQLLQDPILGAVQLKPHARAKRLKIRLDATGTVLLTYPKHFAPQKALAWAQEQVTWVQTQRQQLEDKRPKFSTDTPLVIGAYQFQLIPHERLGSIKIDAPSQAAQLYFPQDWDLKHPAVQECLKDALLTWARQRAKVLFPPRIRQLAQPHGLKVQQVRIKQMRTRWGSCSSKGNINLSLWLIFLPTELIDYVLYHELAHLKHPHHQASFWAYLEKLLPGSKALDRDLRHYQVQF